MLKFKATGKTISGAIDAGLKKLEVDKNVVEVKVLTKPQNFVLAEVEICVPREVVEKNQHLQNLKKLELLEAEIKNAETKLLKSKAEKDSILNGLLEESVEKVKANSALEFAEKFVAGILKKAGNENFETEFFEDENHINISANGKNLGKMIGINGSRLAHLQYITNVAVSQHFKNPKHVVLDINKFKAKETEKLKALAQEKAKEVLNELINQEFEDLKSNGGDYYIQDYDESNEERYEREIHIETEDYEDMLTRYSIVVVEVEE